MDRENQGIGVRSKLEQVLVSVKANLTCGSSSFPLAARSPLSLQSLNFPIFMLTRIFLLITFQYPDKTDVLVIARERHRRPCRIDIHSDCHSKKLLFPSLFSPDSRKTP